MLNSAEGDFDHNPVLYIDLQLRYHFGCTKQELQDMDDEEWAEHFAILQDIRKEEAKRNQPTA